MLAVVRRSRILPIASLSTLFAVCLIAGPALAQGAGEATVISLSVIEAVILGVVEGLTEYLPVSSTGHLLVANELLGLNDSAAAEELMDAYAIAIQAGAILAVLVVYQERIRQMIDGILGRSAEGRRVLLAVITSFVPTAIIALSLFDLVRDRVFNVGSIAAAWIVGGVVILVLSRTGFFLREGADLGSITTRQALMIGLMQALAIWPGTSRSLITIIAGILVGLSLRAAVEYSFLLGLVTLGAATAVSILRDGSAMVDAFGYFTPAVGLVVAFVSAVMAVKWMVSYLNERGFEVFGWYRVAAGVVALALGAAGAIPLS